MQGSLSEFRLSEILQLVSVQQKTGLLRLVRGQQLVALYFDRGLLVSTRDRRHGPSDPLLGYLERVGWLQPDIASSMRKRLEGSKEDLAEILLDERFLTHEELETTLAEVAQELVHQAFTWRDGTYQFAGGDGVLAGIQNRISLQVDSVLMEAARRADEWPRIQEKLPGPDTWVELVQAPTPELGERPFRVIAKITGTARLGDIVQRARVPEYEVYEIVAQAIEWGHLRLVEKRKARPVAPVEERKPAPRPHPHPAANRWRKLWSLPRPLTWGLALVFAVLAAIIANIVAPYLRNDAAQAELQQLAAAEAREFVRLQIEVHRAAHGRYPRQLTDLVQDEIVSRELLARAAPLHYTVAPDGSRFSISGSSGALESADDLPERR